jgi:uroporphyrinogen decarboxylase
MTSRERLLTAASGGTPDRVPITVGGLVGYNSHNFENKDPSFKSLMDTVRDKADCIAKWNPGSTAGFFATAHQPPIKTETWREGNTACTRTTIQTPKGALTKVDKVQDNVHTVWRTERWCKTPDDVDAALSLPYEPPEIDASDYVRVRAELGDNGIVMASIGEAFCEAMELMEFGEATVWAYTEPDHFEKTVRALHQRVMENTRRSLKARVVDLYRLVGAEYGTPPYMSAEMFDRFVVPFMAEMVELIHSYGAKVRVHSHGRVATTLEKMLATGTDGVDPCEAPPDGDITTPDAKGLVRAYGACLYGNIEFKLLEHGTPQQVRQAVRTCMEIAKPGGGFVLMPTAEPIHTPLNPKTEENYYAYIDAAVEYGRY